MKTSTFLIVLFIGIVSAIIGVLSPIHEIWHWLAAILSGVDATMAWDVTYITLEDVTLFIGYAGMFGEIAVLTLMLFWATYKKHYFIASWVFGYSLSYSLIVIMVFFKMFVPVDLEVMLGNYSYVAVYGIWYLFVLYYALATVVQIVTVKHYKQDMFSKNVSYMARQCKKTLESLRNGDHLRENKYKPLTLVK